MQTFHTILENWKAQIDAFLRAIWDDQPARHKPGKGR